MNKAIRNAAFATGCVLCAALLGCDQKANQSASATDTTRYEYDLSRILFLVPEVYEVPSAAETKDLLIKQKRGEAIKAEYKRLLKTTKILEHAKTPVLGGTNDIALITYNGKTLYNSDVLKSIRLMQHLERIKAKNVSKTKLKKITRDIYRTAIAAFVNSQAYSDYAKAHGITLSEDSLASNKVSVAKQYRCADYKALSKKLSPEEVKLLNQKIYETVITHDAKKDIVSKANISATDDEIQSLMTRFQKVYETSVATNSVVYATASNVYQRIQTRQITFEEAFQDYNQDQDADDDGGWCTVSLNQLTQDDQYVLAERLRTAKPGDVFPPMELDNALCIVKVTAKRVATDKESAPTGNEKETK